jgi:hypothetical protein
MPCNAFQERCFESAWYFPEELGIDRLTYERLKYTSKQMEKNAASLALLKLRQEKTTPEQREEIARKAGKASGVARRKKREDANAATNR